MSHDHSHGRSASSKRLAITLALVLAYMIAEVIGGLVSGSLALLADAGHMFSDAASLGLALFAIRVARKPPTPEKTYGYHRAEILAALVNGATLVAIAIFIVIEAWERIQEPPEVRGGLLLAVAAGGLAVNLAGLWILRGGHEESLNVRGAWLHVLGDTLGSVQAIVAGLLIWLYGWHWVDPVASVLIAVLVTWSAWALLRETVDVLMEGTPKHIDLEAVRAAITGLEGAEAVHDLHVWTITSGMESLSAHVRTSVRRGPGLLREIREVLHRRFGIDHATIQLEAEGYDDRDCVPSAACDDAHPPRPSPGRRN